MTVAFRTDASTKMGAGHVMRCLTLADALRESGQDSLFICRDHPGHMGKLIVERGHRLELLPLVEPASAGDDPDSYAAWLGDTPEGDAAAAIAVLAGHRPDWVVVDHYALDAAWEAPVSRHCGRLMVIDDLANRPHDCDLLLDQNLGRAAADYHKFVDQKRTRIVVGPKYALLRPDFALLREQSLARRKNFGGVGNLLISFGGVDKDNATGAALAELQDSALPLHCTIRIIMGPSAPWRDAVREQAKGLPWNCEMLVGVDNMARLMADADLAIGAAGSTSWERCALGVPMLIAVLADNQREAAGALIDAGAALPLQLDGQGNDSLKQHLARIAANGSSMTDLSERGATVCDGRGTERVMRILFDESGLLGSVAS